MGNYLSAVYCGKCFYLNYYCAISYLDYIIKSITANKMIYIV